jgi:hypothetical protein
VSESETARLAAVNPLRLTSLQHEEKEIVSDSIGHRRPIIGTLGSDFKDFWAIGQWLTP